MNHILFVAMPVLALSGALMLLMPHISPRRYFFAVTVDPGFPSSDPGRAIARFYQTGILVEIVLSGLLVLALAAAAPELSAPAAFLLPTAGGFAQFLVARSKAQQFAVTSGVREAALTEAEEGLPRWILLALPPFAGPLAAAVYLRAHWAEIPQRIAVHFGIDGQPNRWVEKSPHAVYGTLLFSAAFLLLILLLGLATYYGSRRLPQRAVVLKLIVAMSYYISLLFTGIALMSVIGFSPLLIWIPTPLFLVVVVYCAYKMTHDPKAPSETTPDECWHLGAIYYNPQDPAIFVQKRMGFGYTANFGNRLSWLILAAFAASLLAFTAVLR